ncbi:MAG: hypothetical protein Q7R96_01865 [Nanoarchaeota archaeon]|nr:hypothetical protein [Nanoarchaeota archaeon]
MALYEQVQEGCRELRKPLTITGTRKPRRWLWNPLPGDKYTRGQITVEAGFTLPNDVLATIFHPTLTIVAQVNPHWEYLPIISPQVTEIETTLTPHDNKRFFSADEMRRMLGVIPEIKKTEISSYNRWQDAGYGLEISLRKSHEGIAGETNVRDGSANVENVIKGRIVAEVLKNQSITEIAIAAVGVAQQVYLTPEGTLSMVFSSPEGNLTLKTRYNGKSRSATWSLPANSLRKRLAQLEDIASRYNGGLPLQMKVQAERLYSRYK